MNDALPRTEPNPVQWKDPPALRALLFVAVVPLAAFLLDVILAVAFRKLSKEVSVYAFKAIVYFFYFAFGIWTAHYFYRFRRPYLLVLTGIIALLVLRFVIVTAVDSKQLTQAMLNTSAQASIIYAAFALTTLLFRYTESRLEFAEAKQIIETVDPFTEKKCDTGTCSKCGLPTVVGKECSLSFLGKRPVYVCSNCNSYLGGNPVNNIFLGLTEAASCLLFIIGSALNMQGSTSSSRYISLLFLAVGVWDGLRRTSSGTSGMKRRTKTVNVRTVPLPLAGQCSVRTDVGLERMMMNKAQIVVRSIGALAALCTLALYAFNVQRFIGHEPETDLFLFYLAVVVFPSFLVVVLVAFGKFWWTCGIGLWLLAAAIMTACDAHGSPISMLLVLATATICMMPLLNQFSRKTESAGNVRQQPRMSDGIGGMKPATRDNEGDT